MKKRFWALLLAVMMVVSVLPTSAFADDDELVRITLPNHVQKGARVTVKIDDKSYNEKVESDGGERYVWVQVDDPEEGQLVTVTVNGATFTGTLSRNNNGWHATVSANGSSGSENTGKTGTVTFRIINGTWQGLPVDNAGSGVSVSSNEVTFTTFWYTNGNNSGYVYDCSNTEGGDNTSGAYFEKFLLAILGTNGATYIKPDEGYKVTSMYWEFGDNTTGLVNNQGDANEEMKWLSTEEKGWLNIHQCDNTSSIKDWFPAKAVYILTLTKESYTITYTDGVKNEEVFADQRYTGVEFHAETPGFDTNLTTEGIQAGEPEREGYTFKGWAAADNLDPKFDELVIRDRTYVAQWEKIPDPTYGVTYEFVSEDGTNLPAEVTSKLATSDINTYKVGVTATNNAPATYDVVEVKENGITVGTWTF